MLVKMNFIQLEVPISRSEINKDIQVKYKKMWETQ